MAAYVDSTGVTNLTADIKALADTTYPANTAIAAIYSSTSTYSVGDYCVRNGLLYKCNTAIGSGGEAWNSAHWTLTNVVSNFGTNTVPATANPLMDGTAAVGISSKYAREDHVHPHDSSIPTKTSDLTNDSGFITSYTETDPVFTASEKVQFAVVEVNENIVIVNSSGNPVSYDDIINAYKKSKGIIIAFLDGGDVSDGWLAQLTSYNDTTSTIKMQSFSTYNELLLTATENNGIMIVTDIIQRPMECIENPGNSSDGDILVYNGTSNTWISAASSSINIKSDWEEDDSTDPAYIQNKPPIKAGAGSGALLMGQAALGNQQANVINEASGANSLVLGIGNRAKGVSSIVIGQQSEAGEKYSISDGVYIRNDARFSLAMGQQIYANDRYSISVGNGYPHLFKITGAANATTYTYDTLPPQISAEVLDRTLCLGLRIAPYSISIVTAIDVNNHTVTVDRTLSETAISDVNCYIWINHGSTEYYSALIGSALETASDNQLIIGNLNRLNANAAFIIGNGVSDSNGSYPSNSTEILKDGSAWFAGTVSAGTTQTPATISANNDLTTKAYVDGAVADVAGDIPTKTSDLTNDSGFIAAPSANVDEVIAYNGTTWVADKRMVILSYGSSTWTDFINAYNSNAVVYCRASSNSNPASGAQTRMAFMAYVNSATPTNVEFQYYRSVSSHSDSQQGDQVFIYKLDKTAGWSVTTRNAFTKIVAGTGLSSSYASQTLTLSSNDVVYVGADAPSDSNVKIWLDTDEPGMSAVSSVNGATGTVVLDAEDVGAMSEWELLWTNASPTSAFGAQTIQLDLSSYDAVIVTAKHWTDNIAKRNEIAFIGATDMILTVQSPTNIKLQTLRKYHVLTSGVQFENGKGTNDSLGTYDSSNAAIPLSIYGVKGVQTS